MPRKKKKQPLTIQSSETKILLGLIIFLIGLATLISSFTPEQTPLFEQITLKLGYSSLLWGISLIYLSLFLLLKKKSFVSTKQAVGLGIFSTSLSILLSFWQIEEQLNNPDALRGAGGELGKVLHLALKNSVGSFIELIVVLIFLVVSFSLITGTTLEQIMTFLESSLPDKDEKEGFSIRSFFKKYSQEPKEDDIKINGGNEAISETEDEMEARMNQIFSKEKENEAEQDSTQKETTSNNPPINLKPQSNSKSEAEETKEPQKPQYTNWVFPSVDILQEPEIRKQDKKIYKDKAMVIERTLKNFHIQAKVVEVSVGPTVVRFSLNVEVGTKVSKIKNLSNDLALALASQTSSVRIEAPIPGTSFVGIEIPNPTPNFVYTKDMVKKLNKEKDKYELPLILGKNIMGQTSIKDLARIPHLLVAGATGTGKSVAINSLLTGLLMTKTPDEVKFIMIDPKMGVEMAIYNGIPHLLNPVITDPEAVVNALQWTIEEMMKRYRQLKQVKAKKITEYNQKVGFQAMPYIIVVVDEMADLMLTSSADVETKIQRLAQMGRAVGIHLILATQKPTVNVITGLIKSNIPGRMAFAVATSMDSRVILDETGAETLLGNGDMLYKDQTTPKSLRIQGTYTATEDTEKIITNIKDQVTEEDVEYSQGLAKAIENGPEEMSSQNGGNRDPEFNKALEIVVAAQKASASFLQRKMSIGYNKAARIIDELHESGIVGPQDGSKPRKVFITSLDQLPGNEQDGDTE